MIAPDLIALRGCRFCQWEKLARQLGIALEHSTSIPRPNGNSVRFGHQRAGMDLRSGNDSESYPIGEVLCVADVVSRPSSLRMLPYFMAHQTTVATILEFPTVAESWIPPHASQCTADDIEFHSLRLLQHSANASCKPVTLWPSQNCGPRWAGRDASRRRTHAAGPRGCCQECNAAGDAAPTTLPCENR